MLCFLEDPPRRRYIGEWCIFFSYQTSKSARIKSIFYKIGLNFYILGTFKAENTATSLFSADTLLIKFCIKFCLISFWKYFVGSIYLILCFAWGQPSVWNSNTREKPTNMCHIHRPLLNQRRKENFNAKAKTYESSVGRHQCSEKSLLNKTLRPDSMSKENNFE